MTGLLSVNLPEGSPLHSTSPDSRLPGRKTLPLVAPGTQRPQRTLDCLGPRTVPWTVLPLSPLSQSLPVWPLSSFTGPVSGSPTSSLPYFPLFLTRSSSLSFTPSSSSPRPPFSPGLCSSPPVFTPFSLPYFFHSRLSFPLLSHYSTLKLSYFLSLGPAGVWNGGNPSSLGSH